MKRRGKTLKRRRGETAGPESDAWTPACALRRDAGEDVGDAGEDVKEKEAFVEETGERRGRDGAGIGRATSGIAAVPLVIVSQTFCQSRWGCWIGAVSAVAAVSGARLAGAELVLCFSLEPDWGKHIAVPAVRLLGGTFRASNPIEESCCTGDVFRSSIRGILDAMV